MAPNSINCSISSKQYLLFVNANYTCSFQKQGIRYFMRINEIQSTLIYREIASTVRSITEAFSHVSNLWSPVHDLFVPVNFQSAFRYPNTSTNQRSCMLTSMFKLRLQAKRAKSFGCNFNNFNDISKAFIWTSFNGLAPTSVPWLRYRPSVQ